MMAHGAAESVAPTNYYTEITVGGGGGREGWRDERMTGSRWTCLVLGIGREELAVEMCGQDNAPWCGSFVAITLVKFFRPNGVVSSNLSSSMYQLSLQSVETM
jgi:hypothetical protein